MKALNVLRRRAVGDCIVVLGKLWLEAFLEAVKKFSPSLFLWSV